jgi:ABC-2 type transport system permease protein
MWKTLKKYWFLFWKFRSLRFMLLLEYRGNFWFWMCVSIMWTFFNFFFFDLIIGARGNIAGWDRNEMYVLVATFTMIDAFTWSFFYHTMGEYISSIFNGTMTYTLTRPVSPQYLLSIQTNSYTNIPRFFIGLVVLIMALQRMNVTPNLWSVLGYVLFCVVSLLFVYSVWFIAATCAFWVDRLDNINELVPATRRMWQTPKEVYTGIASTLFTVILPFGLVAALPSEILLGKALPEWLIFYTVFTLFALYLSKIFFTYSVRKYSGTAN